MHIIGKQYYCLTFINITKYEHWLIQVLLINNKFN